MPMPRNSDRNSGTSIQDWKPTSSPQGYDQPEFEPAAAARDYRRQREHGPDDERRRLRNASAAMDGEGPQTEGPHIKKDEKWDEDDAMTSPPVSRLYRD